VLKGEYEQRPGAATKRKASRHGRGMGEGLRSRTRKAQACSEYIAAGGFRRAHAGHRKRVKIIN
jgi:hypothetical protein